ncbi:MAG: site-specific integrase [Planctomycetia bacterium]|nr:site-specific integrase [Planctomycetia bacterium]
MTLQRVLLRVGDFYYSTYEPHFLPQAAPKTLAAYREALTLWRSLTEDPPIDAVSNLTMATFRAELAKRAWRGKSLSPATVNKHLAAIGAILAKAGPAGPRNRDALSLIAQVPWAKPLKLPRRRPRPSPQELLGKIYAACGVAVAPAIAGVTPAAWWRAWIVVASQVGIRRQAMLSLEWSDLDLARRTLRVRAEEDKCGVERLKPLKEVVVRHLVAIRSADARVFAWPYATWRTLYREWRRIQAAAGVRRGEWYKLHALKATCGTQVARVGGAHAVRAMLDHSSIATSELYVDATEWLREAVERAPHPVEFDQLFQRQQGG